MKFALCSISMIIAISIICGCSSLRFDPVRHNQQFILQAMHIETSEAGRKMLLDDLQRNLARVARRGDTDITLFPLLLLNPELSGSDIAAGAAAENYSEALLGQFIKARLFQRNADNLALSIEVESSTLADQIRLSWNSRNVRLEKIAFKNIVNIELDQWQLISAYDEQQLFGDTSRDHLILIKLNSPQPTQLANAD